MSAAHDNGSPASVRLPRPESLTLHRFSLYSETSTVETEFPDGVFCLAGANGLGKSTFLTALNYAITGVVPDPNREFRGVEDYYGKVRASSEAFFRGRIADEDAEAAQVELVMRAGQRRYRLVRGMFNSRELREFEVSDVDSGEVLIGQDPTLSDERRHDLYRDMVVADLRLQDFAQLAFLQHFVVTFDERRELLFWGPRTLPAAMFIAFGLDPERAARADLLQETVRKTDSLARNYSWQASDWKRQLENLEKATDDAVGENEGVAARHKELLDERQDIAGEIERAAKALADTQVRIAERSASLRALRAGYDDLWTARLQGRGHPSVHPVVVATIDDARCAVCGTEGDNVVQHVRGAIDDDHCPLCASALGVAMEASTATPTELEQLDKSIVSEQNAIAASEAVARDLETRLHETRARLDIAAEEIARYERDNDIALLRERGELDVVGDRYRSAMAEQLRRKETQLKRRDQARAELRQLQRELVDSYDVARDTFVPDFRKLAERFLGLTLDVELVKRRNEVSLLLTVQGGRRRAEQDLSESQRFFIDIALRMALVAQLSPEDSDKGLMLLDTPEGSLDIAYEARAGDMLATFVKNGYALVMTANINTSELLQRLAERCGHQLMRLERMTDWTVLSEVQADEEKLFTDAYREIEEALERGS